MILKKGYVYEVNTKREWKKLINQAFKQNFVQFQEKENWYNYYPYDGFRGKPSSLSIEENGQMMYCFQRFYRDRNEYNGKILQFSSIKLEFKVKYV